MAIQFARMRVLTRSKGHCAVRSAAYNARAVARSERTGEKYSFKDRGGLEHHEVLLPENAPEDMHDFEIFWNKVQLAEKRVNSQEAKELLLALPSNPEITAKMRLDMARGFVQDHFVAFGLGCQLDIHGGHKLYDDVENKLEDASVNYHAHVLITTRRVEPYGMGEKARDMNGLFAKGYVMDGERWGELWRDYQNDYFMCQGLDIRVDEISLMPGEHIGPERMRTEADVLAIGRNHERAILSSELMQFPERILEQLALQKSSFTVDELNRYIDRHGFDEKTATEIFKSVIYSPEILYTVDKNGELDERFTTRTVRAEEAAAMAISMALNAERDASLALKTIERVARSHGLSSEQTEAMKASLSGKRLTVIRGRAGTGKSYALKAIKEGLVRSGRDVIGLGPTNMVASALRTDGFDKAFTVHSFLFQDNNDRISLKEGTRLIVDEAAMLDSRTMRSFLEAAYRHRAAVILVGDDGQLSAIERGGLFRDIARTVGAVEITAVRRQTEDWSRQATEDLAQGDIKAAIDAYDKRGFIMRSADEKVSKKALIGKWKADFDADPAESRFVFAYRNKDVNAFNMAMREHLQTRGVVARDNHCFMTKHGRFDFSVGDQLVMTATDKRARLINGQGGKVVGIEGASITFEPSQGDSLQSSELLTIDTSSFDGFRHSYAGTIYKGQGRTVDHAYIYHTSHWGQANNYVALSRHRETAHMFVAGEYRDINRLAKSLRRDDGKVSSLALELADKVGIDTNLGHEFELNAKGLDPVGLNDTYEDALEDMKQYRRVDPRAYAYADYRAGVAAVEINNSGAASEVAMDRGIRRQVIQQSSSAKNALAHFSSAKNLITRSAKMLVRGMGM